MPRYYFDILDGERPTTDPRGVDLDGIEEAEAEAIINAILRVSTDMTEDSPPDGDDRAVVVVWDDYQPLLKVTRSGVCLSSDRDH